MKKSHGPAFRRELKPLMECDQCKGAGLSKGIFFDMDCAACNASGWVCLETGHALPLGELVAQLSMRLRATVSALAKAQQAGGARAQYEQNNRRGAGGTNYTGD